MVHILVYMPSSVVGYWRTFCPGEELTDSLLDIWQISRASTVP